MEKDQETSHDSADYYGSIGYNMSKLDHALEELIAAILDSDEYREYDRARNEVKQYPEWKALADEFRERIFVLQSSDDSAFEQFDRLEKEYAEVTENPVTREFLAAELAFCRMMQDINLRMTDAIHFE